MATKPSDVLNRLPSASELLEKPPIRALVRRWNRSAVATGVRSFLDELRNDLERRTAEIHPPSLRELAERAARYILERQQPAERSAINATGKFFGRDWSAAPIADAALERVVSLGSGFALTANTDMPSDAAAALVRLTGAEAATVVHSYSGATCLALAAIAGQRAAVIARAEMGSVAAGCSLVDLASAAQVHLQEVGAVDFVRATDYEQAVNERTAAIVHHGPEEYRVVGPARAVPFESLVAVARDCELPLIDLLGRAPLVEELPFLSDTISSAAASLATGASLTILRGDGLIGGPPCGILLGSSPLIDRIESHSLFPAWAVPPATAAALHATLLCYDDRSELRQTIPLFQMLSASPDNLRQRAERLAPQLAQATDVESAVAVATENDLGPELWRDWKLASYAISLSAAGGDIDALTQRLRQSPTPVVGRRDNDRLVLDLRTVLPRQDRQLVDTVVSGRAAATHEPAVPAERS